MRFIFLAFVLTGCVTLQDTRTVRQSDLDSWVGVSADELTSHPLFSTLPREVRPMSQGAELHIYSNMLKVAEPVSCQEKNGWIKKVECSGGGESVRGCVNQFVIKDGIVQSYRPVAVGNAFCFTDCSLRPASRPCI